MGRTRKIVLGGLGTVFLLLVAGGAWLYVQFERAFPPEETLPALVRNLPRQVAEIEPAFQQRVHAKFPKGMRADALTAELRREGFTIGSVRLNLGQQPPVHFAVVEWPGLVCKSIWGIWWQVDAQDQAQDIKGSFRQACS